MNEPQNLSILVHSRFWHWLNQFNMKLFAFFLFFVIAVIEVKFIKVSESCTKLLIYVCSLSTRHQLESNCKQLRFTDWVSFRKVFCYFGCITKRSLLKTERDVNDSRVYSVLTSGVGRPEDGLAAKIGPMGDADFHRPAQAAYATTRSA